MVLFLSLTDSFAKLHICAILCKKKPCKKCIEITRLYSFLHFCLKFYVENFADMKNSCIFAYDLRMHRGVEQW